GFRYSFTPLQGCFSPFPHGTGSLSVTREYLALPDGPGGFQRDSSCPAVLRILLKRQSVSYTGLSPCLALLPIRFYYSLRSYIGVLQPHCECTMIWALPLSLAATWGIVFSFSSCRYFGVSVLCVFPAYAYCI